MTLLVSLCVGPDWIIYAWVKWSVVKLLESSAISIPATASFRGRDLCLAVRYQLRRANCGEKPSRWETWRQRDKWQKRDRQMEREGKKREHLWETKERVMEQWEVYAVCQHKESEMSVFVLHQWMMAAIIPPNGYKQAILAHCFHTQMKQAEFSTVGIPRASMENGVWKHVRHKDWWGEI